MIGFEEFLNGCDFTLGQLDGKSLDFTVTVIYSFAGEDIGTDHTYDAIGIMHDDESVLCGFHWTEPDAEQLAEFAKATDLSSEEEQTLKNELADIGEILLLRDVVPLGRVDRIRTDDKLMSLLDAPDYRGDQGI